MAVSTTHLTYLEEKANALTATAEMSSAYASGPDLYATALADNLAAQKAWNELLTTAAGYLASLTQDEIQNTGFPHLLSETMQRASDHLQALKSIYLTLQEGAKAAGPKPTYQRAPKKPTYQRVPFPGLPAPAPPGAQPGDVMPDGSVVQTDGTLAFPSDLDGTTALVTGAAAVGAGSLIGWYVAKSMLGGLLGGLGGLGALLVLRGMKA